MLISFLRKIFSCEGVEVDPRKIEVVKRWPRPLNATNIQSFLGLFGYYKRFVDEFLYITSPLTSLTKTKSKFECSKSCEERFQLLKDRQLCLGVDCILGYRRICVLL